MIGPGAEVKRHARHTRLLVQVSAGLCLHPGDVIATGTPSGVGFAMQPPRCLEVGDVMRARITGLGELVNAVVE